MIYGGYNGSSNVDKIYKYNQDGGKWDEVNVTMSKGKSSMTAIKVSINITNACAAGR